MNRRKVNIITCVLNILLTVVISLSIVPSIIDSDYSSLQSKYEDGIEDMFFADGAIFIIIFGIVNIVNGIINRKQSKVLFWNIIIGLIQLILNPISYNVIEDHEICIVVLNILVILICSIRNIIVMIKKRRISKKIIIYIISLIYGLVHFIAIEEFDFIMIFSAITIICSLVMYILNLRHIENEKFENKVSLVISILNIVIMMAVILYMCIISLNNFITYTSKVNISNQYKDKLKNAFDEMCIQSSGRNNNTNDEIYIPVCKNNKWGYINKKGEEIISCKYDEVTEFFTMRYDTAINEKGYNLLFKIAIVRENEQFKVINTEEKILGQNEGSVLPWIESKDIYEGIDEIEESKYSDKEYELSLEPKEDLISWYLRTTYSEDAELSNGIYLRVTENGEYYNLLTEKNGEIISTVENVEYLPDNRYSDGSIPFYNIEKDIQGWIDLNGRKNYIEGVLDNYIIFDVKGETILIRNRLTNKIEIYNKNGSQGEMDDVRIYSQGMIVKNSTTEVYINNSNENIGGFFDKIDEAYIENDLLIVQKYGNYYLMNTNGEILTDTEYDVIRGQNNFIEDSEEVSGYYGASIKDRLINNYYFNSNTEQLPEEIIQSSIF